MSELDVQAKATLSRVQRRLEQFYRLEQAPSVVDFVRPGGKGSRETLMVRQADDSLEIALLLPPDLPATAPDNPADDAYMQLVEGVSHFVYLAERARTELPATRLELEMQAEVDKFVLLVMADERRKSPTVRSLHATLYERVRFLHPRGSEAGDRYRLANDLAARFVSRLLSHDDAERVERTLRRFYRSGQTDKIRLARAA